MKLPDAIPAAKSQGISNEVDGGSAQSKLSSTDEGYLKGKRRKRMTEEEKEVARDNDDDEEKTVGDMIMESYKSK